MSSLVVEKRDKKSNLRTLRLEGKVPATIYGDNQDPDMVTISSADLVKESSKRGFFSRVVTLKLGSKNVDVLTKDIQREPLYDQPIHVDFMRVNKQQKIRTFVSIDYVNSRRSPAIKKGGVLNIVKQNLEVRCSPYDIPTELVCDLSNLDTGESVTLDSLKLGKDVTPVHPERDNVLATVVAAAEEDKSEAGEEAAAAAKA
ncbi:MAG: 50S ribosomal protein L25/general stress protein Ctc [Alphaproteobacteria bacterium]|nr:MAG: 50S ribosomal protein L25/general stress protein Ctc [Alphaproteobacteria bacterium]